MEEAVYIKDYRGQWKTPFPPFFVTVDAVVYQSGHLLVIRRGHNPGRGKIALPGGFVNAKERIEDAMFRSSRKRRASGYRCRF